MNAGNFHSERKRKVLRSPSYPAFSLSEALDKARVIFKQEGRTPAAPHVLLKHLGYRVEAGKNPSGPSGRTLSALKQYGLLEERDGKYVITQAVFDLIKLSDRSVDRIATLKEAAWKPNLFREIFNFYKGALPSDANLRDHLLKVHSFNPASVGNFIKIFRETSELVSGAGSGHHRLEKTRNGWEEDSESEERRTIEPASAIRSKVLTVPLDPITSDSPKFAQLLLPLPISDDQKQRLLKFIENL